MIEMYYYFRDGVKVWTSNEVLALSRARILDSEIFKIEIPIPEK